MSMLHIESGLLYCTHCGVSLDRNMGQAVYHPKHSEVGTYMKQLSCAINRDSGFLDRLKTCPHAGHLFQFPEAVQLTDGRPS